MKHFCCSNKKKENVEKTLESIGKRIDLLSLHLKNNPSDLHARIRYGKLQRHRYLLGGILNLHTQRIKTAQYAK